ncbi:MAG: DNA polymerase IV [Desulfobacterales bacterium]|nr:DNA polymerase IV [Desulfobacterales bacterium]MBF0396486.1 DNA polymerase IV [Desulfobacterales bacterium]
MEYRKIIHVDMDAFYASVEQRDQPKLKGKPVIVGGAPKSRGVVAACSYEARKYGIHSAMPSKTAYKFCPCAVFLPPRFDVYESVSIQIRDIFYQYTDLVEPLSLDEAYLDVTDQKHYATRIAKEIRQNIHKETGLTASAGVSYNKFLAKIASDVNKPNGMRVILPEEADMFIEKLPIGKFYGVGKVTEKRMHDLGIKTGADLKRMDKTRLVELFGKSGLFFYDIARGIDHRTVETNYIRKSVGREITLPEDITDMSNILKILEDIAISVENLLNEYNAIGQTVVLKLKYFDFQSVTRNITDHKGIQKACDIMRYIEKLIKNTEAGRKKVRLLGISISNFIDDNSQIKKYKQLPLNFKGFLT